MTVVVAPDSFKGTLDATAAAGAIAAGWRSVRPRDAVRLLPLADGGEGTLDVLAAAIPGAVLVPAPGVSGPDGRPVDAAWLACPDGTAVVELARSSGLPLMATPDPLGAHTAGLGEVIRAAVRAPETRRVVVALGGSASTDGGTGALGALGARFLDDDGVPLPTGGGSLVDLARVDVRDLIDLPDGGITCLVDVDAPLLGGAGAAAVFGPQKGASPADVAVLERGMARLVEVLDAEPGASDVAPARASTTGAALAGAGAAGGTAFGFAAVLGARIVPGAAHLAELAGLDRALAGAGLLLTGEGSFDAQSLGGKVVGEALARSRRVGTPAAVVAGRVADPDLVPGVPTASLTSLAGSGAAALAEPARWAFEGGAYLAHAWCERPWSGRPPDTGTP